MATPLTINQRVHILVRHGSTHEEISALLNITVAQVNACLADPALVVADPYTAAP